MQAACLSWRRCGAYLSVRIFLTHSGLPIHESQLFARRFGPILIINSMSQRHCLVKRVLPTRPLPLLKPSDRRGTVEIILPTPRYFVSVRRLIAALLPIRSSSGILGLTVAIRSSWHLCHWNILVMLNVELTPAIEVYVVAVAALRVRVLRSSLVISKH